jgi:hypothetical protein
MIMIYKFDREEKEEVIRKLASNTRGPSSRIRRHEYR